MPLTQDQKTKIKKILTDYRSETRSLVSAFKKDVSNSVSDTDKKKAQQIRNSINAS
jgi:hypothetical protein